MDQATKRLVDAGLVAAAQPQQAPELMVNINSPQGVQQVPVLIGIFMLIDVAATTLIQIKDALASQQKEVPNEEG